MRAWNTMRLTHTTASIFITLTIGTASGTIYASPVADDPTVILPALVRHTEKLTLTDDPNPADLCIGRWCAWCTASKGPPKMAGCTILTPYGSCSAACVGKACGATCEAF